LLDTVTADWGAAAGEDAAAGWLLALGTGDADRVPVALQPTAAKHSASRPVTAAA